MEYLSSQEYRHIVRIVGTDIPGERKLIVGLTQIKGIGFNFATAIASTLKINQNSNIGHLTEENVKAIEKLILNPIDNMYICGEAFSLNQAWIEGALETSRDIVNLIKI